MVQFLEVTDEEDFSTLKEEGKNSILDLTSHPNSFWLHPDLFLAVSGPHTIRVVKMASAVLVLQSIWDGGSGENENSPQKKS
jgi:hypothetical protein